MGHVKLFPKLGFHPIHILFHFSKKAIDIKTNKNIIILTCAFLGLPKNQLSTDHPHLSHYYCSSVQLLLCRDHTVPSAIFSLSFQWARTIYFWGRRHKIMPCLDLNF